METLEALARRVSDFVSMSDTHLDAAKRAASIGAATQLEASASAGMKKQGFSKKTHFSTIMQRFSKRSWLSMAEVAHPAFVALVAEMTKTGPTAPTTEQVA